MYEDLETIIYNLRDFKYNHVDLPLEILDRINDALNSLTFILPYLT